MRQADGRPSAGMRPQVTLPGAKSALGPITLLLIRREPREDTAAFRHMVRRTHDPAERLASALRLLQATHYQRPRDFSDVMTALFGPGSETARQLVASGHCLLAFDQYRQRYVIPCAVRSLSEQDAFAQATLWHNRLFNPTLPEAVSVLAFTPDWARAEADPPPVSIAPLASAH